MFGHRRTIEWLHAYGAFLAPRNSAQETPLHLAATAGHWECVYALLKLGAPIRDERGDLIALDQEDEDAKERRREFVDAQDCSGWTPLCKAIFWNSTSVIVRHLLKFGADINHLDLNGRSAIDVATYWNMSTQIEWLLHLRSKPAHVPGQYVGSAAEEAGVIAKGSKVVLTDEAANVFAQELKQHAIDTGALPLPPLFDRSEPYFKFVDCLNISDKQRKSLLDVYGDTHDGPLLPGIVGTVSETDSVFKSTGQKWAKLPYCVSVSFGDSLEALQRWGVLAKSDDPDENSESVDEDDIVHGEWRKGSANNIRWWYPAAALRLATKEEAATCVQAPEAFAGAGNGLQVVEADGRMAEGGQDGVEETTARMAAKAEMKDGGSGMDDLD